MAAIDPGLVPQRMLLLRAPGLPSVGWALSGPIAWTPAQVAEAVKGAGTAGYRHFRLRLGVWQTKGRGGARVGKSLSGEGTKREEGSG